MVKNLRFSIACFYTFFHLFIIHYHVVDDIVLDLQHLIFSARNSYNSYNLMKPGLPSTSDVFLVSIDAIIKTKGQKLTETDFFSSFNCIKFVSMCIFTFLYLKFVFRMQKVVWTSG